MRFSLYVTIIFKTLMWVSGLTFAQHERPIKFNGVPQVDQTLRKVLFKQPSKHFRPIALWHINGEKTSENVKRQILDLKKHGFGAYTARNDDLEMRKIMIAYAKDLNMLVMGRDGTGYPSGGASGQIEKLYPQHLRKVLEKTEYEVKGFSYWKCFVPGGKLMAAVAMNKDNLERIDLKPFINEHNILSWEIPRPGDWSVMFFNCVPATFWKRDMPVDYLDPEALTKLREVEYDVFAEQNSDYLRDPIVWTQYDDVGFLAREKTWTRTFNEKFFEINGFDPTLYYPALWYHIGSETDAARVAFFNTRSELLAEGFPKMVKEWASKHLITTIGQPPGNYKDQPVDILGDAFKFFRYTDIPQTDAIIHYGNGLHGFKLTSAASDVFDRPITMTEAYGAFHESTLDVKMMYRVPIELFNRGGNSMMTHYGSWNHPDKRNMPYSVMGYANDIVQEFKALNNFIGRSCYMLTGGRTVANIALLYPIASLQAGFYFDAADYTGKQRRGWWTYPESDYLAISGLLTNDIRRDFTFVHPEYLVSDTYTLKDKRLRLNTENFQEYEIIIIPGGKVISYAALKKIKLFYDNGGKVIATTLLPSISAEMGKDREVKALIEEIFGKDAATKQVLNTNNQSGMAIFISQVNYETLTKNLEIMAPLPDVFFPDLNELSSELGYFSYIHKVRDGKDIYYFGNSSDEVIATNVLIKGKLQLESWNPHDGKIIKLKNVSYQEKDGQIYTKCTLELSAVESIFWLGSTY
ncbi:MAG: glycosyl hydrolase [Cyclobacteriaceae bacterium]